MEALKWIQFIAGAAFLIIGVVIFGIEMIGVFRFKYVLNRMHAAAMGDTLGIGSCFLGLMILNGMNFTTLKMFFVIVFLWFASPTASHLIARLEVVTNEASKDHYERIELDKKKGEE